MKQQALEPLSSKAVAGALFIWVGDLLSRTGRGAKMNKIECPKCGKLNPGDALKCIYCGARLR